MIVHIMPINDLRPHDEMPACWCRPQEIEPDVYSHNSLDGRETYERGRARH